MTVITLKQGSALQFTIGRVTALGTDKALRPAPLEQGLATLLFGAICCKKFLQTLSWLKLYLVF